MVTEVAHVAVVVSPLLTIIQEQVTKLQQSGIKAYGITGDIAGAELKGNVFQSDDA